MTCLQSWPARHNVRSPMPGIHNLTQLAKFSEIEIKELHGIGTNALITLHAALKAKGLSFAKK